MLIRHCLMAIAHVGTHGKYSFKYNACQMWNELPGVIKTAKTKNFFKIVFIELNEIIRRKYLSLLLKYIVLLMFPLFWSSQFYF